MSVLTAIPVAARRAARYAPPRAAPAPARPSVLLLTEGTYPYVMGGVSTWCDLLLNGVTDVDWLVYPLTAGPGELSSLFTMPEHARLAGHLQLWGSGQPGPRMTGLRRSERRTDLAAVLVQGLLGWQGDLEAVVHLLVWCRQHPGAVLPTFRDNDTWDAYLGALTQVLRERHPDAGLPPDLDLSSAINLYHTLSWIARTGAAATPRADVALVTAAGWSMLPAVVDKALHGTPILLSEHGLYVRESYLAAVRSSDPAQRRFVTTRLARGLSRMAYRYSDVVAPVADANRAWEQALGVAPDRIRTISNGVPAPSAMQEPPRTHTVVSVGRLDPLKDVQTMLRVAAEVLRRVPDATFLHYGPVPKGQEAYAQGCHRLHEELGLGSRFRFMGSTSDPTGVMRDADVVLMTSISEGFPMSVLEALSQGRPVVTTLVGGVLEAMRGAGLTASAGDVHGLSDALTALLLDDDLAAMLGRRGHARVRRLFGQQRFLDGYRALLHDMVAVPA